MWSWRIEVLFLVEGSGKYILWLNFLGWCKVGLREFGWLVVFMIIIEFLEFRLFISVNNVEIIEFCVWFWLLYLLGVSLLILLKNIIVGWYCFVIWKRRCSCCLELLIYLFSILVFFWVKYVICWFFLEYVLVRVLIIKVLLVLGCLCKRIFWGVEIFSLLNNW